MHEILVITGGKNFEMNNFDYNFPGYSRHEITKLMNRYDLSQERKRQLNNYSFLSLINEVLGIYIEETWCCSYENYFLKI